MSTPAPKDVAEAHALCRGVACDGGGDFHSPFCRAIAEALSCRGAAVLEQAAKVAEGLRDEWTKQSAASPGPTHGLRLAGRPAGATFVAEAIRARSPSPTGEPDPGYVRGLQLAVDIARRGHELEADGPCCRECYYLAPAELRTHKTVEALRAAHDAAVRGEDRR